MPNGSLAITLGAAKLRTMQRQGLLLVEAAKTL